MTQSLPLKVRSYRDLLVWQKGMDLVDLVCDLAGQFPDRERFGLYSQIMRAAVSVPSNIAEGHGHSTSRHFASYLESARGSVLEIETQLLIATRRCFADKSTTSVAMAAADELSRMLMTLRQRILASQRKR